MRFRFWKKSQWQDLGSVTFSVPAGNYKATYTINYEKGVLDKTIVLVPVVTPTNHSPNQALKTEEKEE